MKKIQQLIIVLILIGISAACMKNEICSPVYNELDAGIYISKENDGTITYVSSTIAIDSIYAITQENNVLMSTTSKLSQIDFPLNDALNKCTYVISSGSTKDTLTISYDKQLLFSSIKCGVYYAYTINKIEYTSYRLKEVFISNEKINVLSNENIQLVY